MGDSRPTTRVPRGEGKDGGVGDSGEVGDRGEGERSSSPSEPNAFSSLAASSSSPPPPPSLSALRNMVLYTCRDRGALVVTHPFLGVFARATICVTFVLFLSLLPVFQLYFCRIFVNEGS
jgi:hypothetical protein